MLRNFPRVKSLGLYKGQREFSLGDRIYFLKTDNVLGVKNGSLGTLQSLLESI